MIISCRGRVSIGRAGSGVRSPESGVRRRVQKHSCEAPGSSVALPERSGKVAGGFEGFLSGFEERSCDDFVMIVLPEVAGDQF